MNNETTFFTPLQKNAAYYRSVARNALKPFFGIAIVAFLIASLLGGASSVTSGISLDVEELGYGQELGYDLIDYLILYMPLLLASAAVSTLVSIAFSIFVSSPIKPGYQRFFLGVYDGDAQKAQIPTLFSFFNGTYYWKSVQLNLLRTLIGAIAAIPVIGATVAAAFIIMLTPALYGLAILILLCGLLLTAVAAIPINYTYTYAFLILAEYPTLSPTEALRNSRNLMRGKKFKLFFLDFSFIGWILLACLTCGIGFLFLTPYMQTARVAFYHDIANREAASDVEFPSLDPDDYSTEV